MYVCEIMDFNHVKQRTLGILCLFFLSFFLSAQVQPASCEASFSASYMGMKATFTNTSSGFSQNVTYSWSFGDGNNSSLENPIHTYQALGTYNVKLKVSDILSHLFGLSYTLKINKFFGLDYENLYCDCLYFR